MSPWLVVASGYLIGSIPFGFILARRYGGIDLRQVGSRNVGATNAFRTTRKTLGVGVVVLDLAKGAAVVWLARLWGATETLAAAAGLASVVGHIYPVWLGWHGGKGVATACGAFALLAPVATLWSAGAFLLVGLTTRYISLGSVSAVSLLGPFAYLTGRPESVLTASVAAATLIVFRHRGNLARVLAGTERRLGQRA